MDVLMRDLDEMFDAYSVAEGQTWKRGEVAAIAIMAAGEIDRLRKALTWQPMETAPPGREVMVECEGGGRSIALMEGGTWYARSNGQWVIEANGMDVVQPVRWLDIPPSKEKAP